MLIVVSHISSEFFIDPVTGNVVDTPTLDAYGFYCVGSVVDEKSDRLYWLVAFEKYVKEMNPGLYVKATNYVDEEGRELTYREIKEREYNNE